MASRSGSSRRKQPLVAKKVFANKSDDDDDNENEDPKNGINGNKDDSDNEMPDLPEGTVVVIPEPVEDKGLPFKGPEFGSSKRRSAVSDPNQYLSIVTCTACRKQININKKGAARRHPHLRVLLCKRCHKFYESGPITKDEDGLDEQCRWCSEGGRLFGCDFCHNAFCRSCVIHNLGRSEIFRIEDNDKWKCYVCNPRPLSDLIENCNNVLDYIKKEEKKAKKSQETEKSKKSQDASKKNDKEKKSSTPQTEKQQEKRAVAPPSKDTKVTPNKPSTSSLLSGALKGTTVHSGTSQGKPPVRGSNTISSNNPPIKIQVYPKTTIASKANGTSTTSYIVSNMAPQVYTAPRVNILPKSSSVNVRPMQYSFMNRMINMSQIAQRTQQNLRFNNPQQPAKQPDVPSALSEDMSLKSMFSLFSQNVNAGNVLVKVDKLISMTSSLGRLLQSVRSNINDNITPGLNLMSNISLKSRETAVECLNGGLELFLQEFQILVGGNNLVNKSVAGNDKPVQNSTENAANTSMLKSQPLCTSTPLKENTVKTETDVVVVQDSADKTDSKGLDNDSSCVILDSDSDENDGGDVEMKPDNDKNEKQLSSDGKDQEESCEPDNEKDESVSASPTKTPKKDKPDAENAEAQLELLEELADEILNKTDSSDSENGDEEADKNVQDDEGSIEKASSQSKKRKVDEEKEDNEKETGSPKRRRSCRLSQDEEETTDGKVEKDVSPVKKKKTKGSKPDDDKGDDENHEEEKSPKKSVKKRQTRSSQDENDDTDEDEREENKQSTEKKATRSNKSIPDDVDDREEVKNEEKKRKNSETPVKKRHTKSNHGDSENDDNDETEEESHVEEGKESMVKSKTFTLSGQEENDEDEDKTEEEDINESKRKTRKSKQEVLEKGKGKNQSRNEKNKADSDDEDEKEEEDKNKSKRKLRKSNDESEEKKGKSPSRNEKGKSKKANSDDETEEEDTNESKRKTRRSKEDESEEKKGKSNSRNEKGKSKKVNSDDETEEEDTNESKRKTRRSKEDESEEKKGKSNSRNEKGKSKKANSDNESEEEDTNESKRKTRRSKEDESEEKKSKSNSRNEKGKSKKANSDDETEEEDTNESKRKTRRSKEDESEEKKGKSNSRNEKGKSKKANSDDETEEEDTNESKRKTRNSKADESEEKKGKSNSRNEKGKNKKANSDEGEASDSKTEQCKPQSSEKDVQKKNKSKTDKKGGKKRGKNEDDDSDDEEKKKKAKMQGKDRGDMSDEDSDDSDDTDSSDLSGGDTFGVKRRKKRKTKGSKSKQGSDSEDFDSELEEDIKKLSKEVKIKKGNTSKSDNAGGNRKEKSAKKTDTKKNSAAKDQKSKKEDNSGESDDENTDEYDPGEAEDEDGMDVMEEAEESDMEVGESEDDNSDENLIEDSSDSEIVINSPKKKKALEKKNKKKKADPSDTVSDSDFETKPKKKLRGKLLDAKLSDSDSDVISPKKRGKKRKAKSESSETSTSSEESDSRSNRKGKKKGKAGKGQKKGKKKRRRIKKVSSSSDEEKISDSDSDADAEKEGSGDEDSPSKKGRKKIRKVLSDKKLTDKTKAAVKAEEERRKRISEKQKLFNHVELEDDPTSPTKCPITKKLVLEMDKETEAPVVEVHKDLVRKLKPHQVEAVQFVWNCTIESLDRLKKEEGSGCILAHCMGLGKTLSIISFLHTIMNHKDMNITRVLVVCPLNTVLNWQHEFEIWIDSMDPDFYEVFELASVKMNVNRAEALKYWHENGGIMILGYEMYRNLIQGSFCRSKKLKKIFHDCLVDPGPDFVVCDEGHILKNDGSAISKSMNLIRTRRRVVLTGTPLQNNLVEYHCMVSFVKPNLLGTRKEFSNRFINPITNGQCADSTSHDVKVMKRRAHILHEKLAGCVQRKDYSALTKFLPPKHEYVISVRLSKVQMDLYSKYLELVGVTQDGELTVKKGRLFSDYQALMRIWTHPWVLKLDEIRQELKAKWDDEDSFIDDSGSGGSDDESDSSQSKSSSSEEDDVVPISSDEDDKPGKKRTRSTRAAEADKDKEENPGENGTTTLNSKEVVKKWTTRSRGGDDFLGIIIPEDNVKQPLTTEWWVDYVTEEDEHKVELSGKLVLLFEILRQSEEIGDKVLVFSQSLLSLNIIEDFLERVDKKFQEETEGKEDSELVEGEAFGKRWTKGEDYFRMDGSTGAQQRKDLASSFNDAENYRTRLFLISTKAGGLGINLVAANRVIIFDASWNPSHDIQSIFRVYRFGQVKPVYVYRFLAQGTMEEKIYERQVTKQSLSQRVVDEHQIERHFNSRDLQELYTFKPDRLDDPDAKSKPTPKLPSDHMLAEMLKSHKEWIVGYHEHDSLLENQVDQELSEEERKAAWKEYEDEKKGIIANVQQRVMSFPGSMAQMGMNPNMRFPNPMNMPNIGMNMGMNMSLSQHNLLQLVQDMKQRFPHLPEDQLTHRVQGVIRQIITGQFMQQQEIQKRQIEQREYQHQQQLQQIQAQIQRQKQQLNQHHMSQAYNPPNPVASGSNMTIQSMLGGAPRPPMSGKKS